MVAPDRLAALGVDRRRRPPRPARPSPSSSHVADEPLDRAARVEDTERPRRGPTIIAGVADLAAALGVEGGASRTMSTTRPRLRRGARPRWLEPRLVVTLDHREHSAVDSYVAVAEELGRAELLEHLAPYGDGRAASRPAPRRRAGARRALLGHRARRSRRGRRRRRARGHLDGEVDREPDRCRGDSEARDARPEDRRRRSPQLARAPPRAAPSPHAACGGRPPPRARPRARRASGRARGAGRRRPSSRRRRRRAGGSTSSGPRAGAARSTAPADDPPQHVAAAVVRGEHAVGDEERHRARVVGEDAQRRRRPRVASGDAAGGGGCGVDERREDVGVEDRRDACRAR